MTLVAVLLVLNIIPVHAVLPDFAWVYKFITSVFDHRCVESFGETKTKGPYKFGVIWSFMSSQEVTVETHSKRAVWSFSNC